MADLKIPNLNNNSDKYLFKKKLFLRRKSKRKLTIESSIMLTSSLLIIYINYLVPNKILIFHNFLKNLIILKSIILNSFSYIYEICLAMLITVSLIFALLLIIGSISRFLKIIKRKTKRIQFK